MPRSKDSPSQAQPSQAGRQAFTHIAFLLTHWNDKGHEREDSDSPSCSCYWRRFLTELAMRSGSVHDGPLLLLHSVSLSSSSPATYTKQLETRSTFLQSVEEHCTKCSAHGHTEIFNAANITVSHHSATEQRFTGCACHKALIVSEDGEAQSHLLALQ